MCGASDGKCACGLVWSVPRDAVVARIPVIAPLDDDDGGYVTGDEAHANAALIAAAPQLAARGGRWKALARKLRRKVGELGGWRAEALMYRATIEKMRERIRDLESSK